MEQAQYLAVDAAFRRLLTERIGTRDKASLTDEETATLFDEADAMLLEQFGVSLWDYLAQAEARGQAKAPEDPDFDAWCTVSDYLEAAAASLGVKVEISQDFTGSREIWVICRSGDYPQYRERLLGMPGIGTLDFDILFEVTAPDESVETIAVTI